MTYAEERHGTLVSLIMNMYLICYQNKEFHIMFYHKLNIPNISNSLFCIQQGL